MIHHNKILSTGELKMYTYNRRLKCMFILWSIKIVSYTLSVLSQMLEFYYSTEKNHNLRIMFIITVSVIYCWLYSSANHSSALSSSHCPAPAKCTQRQREHQRMPNDVCTASHNRITCIYGPVTKYF